MQKSHTTQQKRVAKINQKPFQKYPFSRDFPKSLEKVI